ncbi:hypothetical protein HDU81_002628 [Chytriomyces hyalinus]|nr:hypothetical protein HDU81_002628 [Chytriomyces hyalinus]
MGRKGRDTCRFPAARIKKIMRSDEDVGKITQATPILVSCALELFLKSLVGECVKEARQRSGKKLSPSHLKAAIANNEKFDFLKELVANVPDPTDNDEDADGDSKKKKRKRVAPAAGGQKKKSAPAAAEADDEAGEDPEAEVGEDSRTKVVERKHSIQSLLLNDEEN